MHLIHALIVCVANANVIRSTSLVSNVTDVLISLQHHSNNSRLDELKNKLEAIDTYKIDQDTLSQILLNITKESTLNKTSFYRALNENDHLQFLLKDDNKNLYLKAKEKLNRDDFLSILENTGNQTLMKNVKHILDNYDLDHLDENQVIDEMIAAKPVDRHKFKAAHSNYWDPQGELQDRHEFHRHKTRRLYKGARTSVRYYPFMVSVHVMSRFWCGGVIYWHDLVLTSASCLQLTHNNRFFRENPKILQVRIGSNHSRIGGEMIPAMEVFFHPSYNPKTLKSNIAVIRLRRHIHFNHHRIPKLIEISDRSGGMPSTAEVLLLGWGVTKTSQKMEYEPIFLQREFLPVYPNHFCKEIYGDKFITTSMFCAGTMTTGEGACDHDAGGPAILNGKLAGIISFGPAVCGYPNVPTVFTSVGFYSDWIEKVNESMPDYYRSRKRTTTSTRNPMSEYFMTWRPEKANENIDETSIPPLIKITTPHPEVSITETDAPNAPPPAPLRSDHLPPRSKGRDRDRFRLKSNKPDATDDEGWSIEEI